MARLTAFDPPANVQDFSQSPEQQQVLNQRWSANVNRWANAALIGDVWDRTNYGPRPAFYNPLDTDVPDDVIVAAVPPWGAFPGRIPLLFPNASAEQQQEWADTGQMPPMAINLCTGQSIPSQAYTPTGPRGWQDEYCEWSVARDEQGRIISVMFTCENPEYWLTLWSVDPQTVLQRYRELVSPAVAFDDLCLHDTQGNPVIDPITNQPAYNPLNKWNSGTKTLPDSGGAVHLTSSPNTLGAEYDLAAAATLPRAQNGSPIIQPQPLVCCALYGRVGRHSDPTIGQFVNLNVNYNNIAGARATLTNPPGLYMQTPDFGRFTNPNHPDDDVSTFWTVVRGHTKDPNDPNDIDRILHATFAVPAEKGYTVSDLCIDGQAIMYGSQIAGTITVSLSATLFSSSMPAQQPLACTNINPPNPIPVAALFQDSAVFAAYRAVEIQAKELVLSIPILSFPIAQGQTLPNVACMLNSGTTLADLADVVITVDGEGVTVSIDSTMDIKDQSGTVVLSAYLVTITATSNATVGDRGVYVTVKGQPTSNYPALGLLNVVPQAAPTAPPSAAIRPHFRSGRS